MSDNPYQAPQAAGGIVETSGENREQLRAIAKSQKAIMVCILANILFIVAAFMFPGVLGVLPPLVRGLVTLGIYIAVAVFLGRLAAQLWGIGWGIVFGLLALSPFVAPLVTLFGGPLLLTFAMLGPFIPLISLLIVNQKATRTLKRHGISVGLMGANLSKI
jgi:hypothetical protein